MKKLLIMKNIKLILIVLISGIIFSGCSIKTKSVGVNDDLNMHHIKSIGNFFGGYAPTISYLGQVEINDKNIEIINKSVNQLYYDARYLENYSSRTEYVDVDICNKNMRATNATSLAMKNRIEENCRSLYGYNTIRTQQREVKSGFLLEKVAYPNYLLEKVYSNKGDYYKKIPFITGIKDTIKIYDYSYRFVASLGPKEFFPFEAHLSFIPIDSKLNIILNYTIFKEPLPEIVLNENMKVVKEKVVVIKNMFYNILEKNGLNIIKNEEISLPEGKLSEYLFEIHKIIN
ncbi:hypothetical protein [Aliarcobacter skirrowii]|uniref:hypothetical protein n=1 Tax=Aliarcobacter skirrowii TaxID=28200 RepID=UPI0029B3A4CB|nr:hypothetical protein [Aliarcobacter skirrowii]MDX4037716.1 hypothetical protein [Aliarcobacter skirrowii]